MTADAMRKVGLELLDEVMCNDTELAAEAAYTQSCLWRIGAEMIERQDTIIARLDEIGPLLQALDKS